MNKLMIIGRLTRDPELRAMPNGDPVVKIGIATNEPFKDHEGNKQDHVEYHDAVAFGKAAEVINQYTRKGHRIYVEGPLRKRKYQGQDGADRLAVEIRINQFEFLEPKESNATASPHSRPAGNDQNPGTSAPSAAGETTPRGNWDKDIPF